MLDTLDLMAMSCMVCAELSLQQCETYNYFCEEFQANSISVHTSNMYRDPISAQAACDDCYHGNIKWCVLEFRLLVVWPCIAVPVYFTLVHLLCKVCVELHTAAACDWVCVHATQLVRLTTWCGSCE